MLVVTERKEVTKACVRVVSDGHRAQLEGARSDQIWNSLSLRKNDDSNGL